MPPLSPKRAILTPRGAIQAFERANPSSEIAILSSESIIQPAESGNLSPERAVEAFERAVPSPERAIPAFD